ncbi:MAG: DUF4197 domain-containing protein [Microscillaceae bacterium]|nr:DUF4197 domain-containing protein [Microscillaceae bacterium]MDW8461612.1 DUF4197 domain-containing protein [Cytophagales bacterium]
MQKIIRLLVVGLILSLNACEVAQQIASTGLLSQPTEAENAMGLKEALNVGIRKGVESLTKTDGYFGNPLLKILLPPEAQKVERIITQYIPDGQALIDAAVLKMNRAAEEAAKEALPIFANAIANMTIRDATGILFGADSAATTFLKQNTYNQLVAAYSPKINNSLSSVGATQAWEALVKPYNKFATSPAALLVKDARPINPDLGAYVTQRALDGLFLKVREEEQNIRKNPLARVSDILKRVFGQLDNRK